MGLTERLEQFSRPALMGLTVVAFALCWPVGLGMLVFLIGSRRMGCWNHGYRGQWYGRHAERAERRANERGRGGWHWGETIDGFLASHLPNWILAVVTFALWTVKVFAFCAFQLLIRWSLPRFRSDQLMRLGWQRLLPVSIGNVVVTALLVLWALS